MRANQVQTPNYKAPIPPEVYALNEQANLSIPPEIREQFQRDEFGRVLFFTAPPMDAPTADKPGAALGHSVRYLAARAKRDALLAEKRKGESVENGDYANPSKKAKLDEAGNFRENLEQTINKGLKVLGAQLVEAIAHDLDAIYGDRAKENLDVELDLLKRTQQEVEKRVQDSEERERAQQKRNTIQLHGLTARLSDV